MSRLLFIGHSRKPLSTLCKIDRIYKGYETWYHRPRTENIRIHRYNIENQRSAEIKRLINVGVATDPRLWLGSRTEARIDMQAQPSHHWLQPLGRR